MYTITTYAAAPNLCLMALSVCITSSCQIRTHPLSHPHKCPCFIVLAVDRDDDGCATRYRVRLRRTANCTIRWANGWSSRYYYPGIGQFIPITATISLCFFSLLFLSFFPFGVKLLILVNIDDCRGISGRTRVWDNKRADPSVEPQRGLSSFLFWRG
jgi:hypothetical protein